MPREVIEKLQADERSRRAAVNSLQGHFLFLTPKTTG